MQILSSVPRKDAPAAPERRGHGPVLGRQRRDVRGLRALGPLRRLELHLVALLQRLEAAAGDGAEVDEEILPTSVWRDEAKALRIVEPLDGSGCHENTSLEYSRTRREGALRRPVL